MLHWGPFLSKYFGFSPSNTIPPTLHTHMHPSTSDLTASLNIVRHIFHVHVTVHRNKFLFNKSNRRTNFFKFILSRNSTCFEQFLCPSSGVSRCTFGTGIFHASLMAAFKHVRDATPSILDVLESRHQTCMAYTSAECTVENS
jgi:hypothetical protein